jgi:UDP-N-acetylglucosamine 2-epimerase (non-hydrolysing)
VLRIASVVGGRPHPMKVAPIHHALAAREDVHHVIVDCGFLEKLYAHETYTQLKLPDPIVRLGEPKKSSAGETMRELLDQIGRAFDRVEPHHILIYGDLDASLAAAVAAAARGVDFTHVEAGLRSHDYDDREETSRLAIDRLAKYYVTHSLDAVDALRTEVTDGDEILLTASPAIQSLFNNLTRATNRALTAYALDAGTYCLAAIHRHESLRDPERFKQLIQALIKISDILPVVLLNYRSTASLVTQTFSGIDRQLSLVPTMSYLDYLGLLQGARLVVTDASGIHDEASALGIPCVIARKATHRVSPSPSSERRTVAGVETAKLVSAAQKAFESDLIATDVPALWHRAAGQDIAGFLLQHLSHG